jgi:hypothetical protein
MTELEETPWGDCDTDPWDGPAGNFPVLSPMRMFIRDKLLAGVCPECHQCDGVLGVFEESWAVCHRHRGRWHVGPDLEWVYPQVAENEATSLQNIEVLAGYVTVTPVARQLPDIPPWIEYALRTVLDRLWDETAVAYRACPGLFRNDHLFRYLHDIDRWMHGARML